jgi:hypothetical protein
MQEKGVGDGFVEACFQLYFRRGLTVKGVASSTKQTALQMRDGIHNLT